MTGELDEHVITSEALRGNPLDDPHERPLWVYTPPGYAGGPTVYVLQGTITDHRDGIATDYRPGVGWPEDRNTVHWLENRGTVPAMEISVDVVRRE